MSVDVKDRLDLHELRITALEAQDRLHTAEILQINRAIASMQADAKTSLELMKALVAHFGIKVGP